MNNRYETTATVLDQGQVHLAGVPSAPGTEVEITIKPVRSGGNAADGAAGERAAQLFAALSKARNTESVGPLRREELHDRNVLR